jgi:L-2,4-diaminobutyrate decarboxylase
LLFERIGWDVADYERWNGWLVERQIGFVTPSRHRGRACSRFAIVNPQTTVDDLALLIDSMR